MECIYIFFYRRFCTLIRQVNICIRFKSTDYTADTSSSLNSGIIDTFSYFTALCTDYTADIVAETFAADSAVICTNNNRTLVITADTAGVYRIFVCVRTHFSVISTQLYSALIVTDYTACFTVTNNCSRICGRINNTGHCIVADKSSDLFLTFDISAV